MGKKNRHDIDKDVELFLWFHWQKTRRNPDYINEYKNLIKTAEDRSKKTPLTFEQSIAKKAFKAFIDADKNITAAYMGIYPQGDLNELRKAYVIRNIYKDVPACETYFPEFNHFRGKWRVFFPINPEIDNPDQSLVRYPLNYPILDKTVDDQHEIATFTVAVENKKIDVAIEFLTGYLEQVHDTPERKAKKWKAMLKDEPLPPMLADYAALAKANAVKNPIRKNEHPPYIIQMGLENYDYIKDEGIFKVEINLSCWSKRHLAKLSCKLKKQKSGRVSLNESIDYYKACFRVWDLRQKSKKFCDFVKVRPRGVLMGVTYKDICAAFQQYKRAHELINGKTMPAPKFPCDVCQDRPCRKKTCKALEEYLEEVVDVPLREKFHEH